MKMLQSTCAAGFVWAVTINHKMRREKNEKSFKLSEEAFQMDGKMPLSQAIPLGLQHVLAMFVGNLTPLLIITGACGLAGGEFAQLQLSLLQNAMLVAGIVTLVQLFSIGPVGGKVRLSWVLLPDLSECSIVLRRRWAAVCWHMVRSWVHP